MIINNLFMLVEKINKNIYKLFQSIINKIRFKSFGSKSIIYKPDRIVGSSNISIGNEVYIQKHARIECVTNYAGVKFDSALSIGDGTTIEERCHIVSAGVLNIGKGCMISADVFISDCNHGLLPNIKFIDQPLEVKQTTVGNHCFIGIGAKILPGVTLNDNCVVGANSVVTHDVPQNSIVAGVPAKIIGYIN